MVETTPEYDFTLDIRGESCPYPVMHTLDALGGLSPGEVLEVVTDCMQAFRNIPQEVTKHGYRIFSEVPDGPDMSFYIGT